MKRRVLVILLALCLEACVYHAPPYYGGYPRYSGAYYGWSYGYRPYGYYGGWHPHYYGGGGPRWGWRGGGGWHGGGGWGRRW